MGTKAPLLQGLEGIQFPITTSSPEAQRYFNQGMMLSYGFNHAEAARSFYQVIRLDSNCAMGYWGFALVLGPNYNAGMEADNYERAYQAVQKAYALRQSSSPKERALIEALRYRYVQQPPSDRSQLDWAYAEAMKKVAATYASDPDIGALYAEALMDLHPWDLYEKGTRQPKPWTPALVAKLEQLMQTHPLHPGAHHYYIHALEASAHPEKALASADLLFKRVPGSGHLVHMPSHIYINTGNYHEGSLSNIEAVKVDSQYITACHAQGAYPLAYYPHNYHFLAATATLEGNSRWAWQASQKLQAGTALDLLQKPEWATLQHYYTIPYYIAVKFAFWDTILSLPAPDKRWVYASAIWHYARGLAALGKDQLPLARQELQSLQQLSEDSVLQNLNIWGINSMSDIVTIARLVLEGEIGAAEKNYDKAILKVSQAVAGEDQLNYQEPPDWFFSVRHHLGELYLQAGKYAEAEAVFKKDLERLKKNGWALAGLHQALLLQDKPQAAAAVKAAFAEAWKYADISITSSSPLSR